jgi:hypothetical protein
MKPLIQAPAIQWPEHFHPDRAPVHVVNEMFIPARAEYIWAWLVREPLWPTWYANSRVDWIRDQSRDLALGVQFHWKTFGVSIESCVREFVPCERIAWDGTGLGAQVYHAWLIIPQSGGCIVRTEESQHGWGARLMHLLQPHRMFDGHELWLKSLSIQSQTGMPPAL